MQFAKVLVFVNALVPLALLAVDAARGRLGANPIELVLRSTGVLTLLFLALTLAVTPARKLLGKPALGKLRRMLGLFAFFYGSLHVLTYLWLDQFFDVRAIATDVLTRPFIFLGAFAYGMMTTLAWTSTTAAIRRLGKRWTVIHKRIYYIAALGVVHFWMAVKADTTRPAAFGVVIGMLLLWRFVNREPRAGMLRPS
jgi:sulfoxide reductase heme-binding subunit YedZ